MAKLNEYVAIAEVGDLPRVSQSTVRPWMKAGKILLPRNPEDGNRLFKRADL